MFGNVSHVPNTVYNGFTRCIISQTWFCQFGNSSIAVYELYQYNLIH